MNILITGGCGFIGSNLIEHIINKKQVDKLINVDCLSYAGSLNNTKEFEDHPKYLFENYDLTNYRRVYDTFYKHDITHVIHLAAESHVDNSINNSKIFIDSNITGTHALLEAVRKFKVRFHHVSTDEVYGVAKGNEKFTEKTPYNPQNPYSATKAASDFLVKSYVNTYGIKATISNCCNNYGPKQHEEKFIPVVIESLLNEKIIPVYGNGKNVRDWIHVKDHCAGIWEVFTKGKSGETYLIGADCEKTNLEIIQIICKILNREFDEVVSFVKDRPGHDLRYAIDNSKIKKELNWHPKINLKAGLKKTITYYARYFDKGS